MIEFRLTQEKLHQLSLHYCFMQVVRFQGRAAVPLPGLLGSFSKVFFAQPKTYELYGRVQVDSHVLRLLHLSLYTVMILQHGPADSVFGDNNSVTKVVAPAMMPP